MTRTKTDHYEEAHAARAVEQLRLVFGDRVVPKPEKRRDSTRGPGPDRTSKSDMVSRAHSERLWDSANRTTRNRERKDNQ